MRASVSIAKKLADNSDAEIRNAVEGFASELEIAERAEAAFANWFDKPHRPFWPLCSDGVFRQEMCAAFTAGYIQAARDLGHLPEGGAA